MHYIVVLQKDPDSDYGVIVPDLPGCFSAGSTAEEALANVEEAILCHLEGLLDDGDPLPTPNTIETHIQNKHCDGVLALIDVDLSKIAGKTKRVDITLPQKLIRKIDQAATQQGLSRSAYIAELATLQNQKNTGKTHR